MRDGILYLGNPDRMVGLIFIHRLMADYSIYSDPTGSKPIPIPILFGHYFYSIAIVTLFDYFSVPLETNSEGELLLSQKQKQTID